MKVRRPPDAWFSPHSWWYPFIEEDVENIKVGNISRPSSIEDEKSVLYFDLMSDRVHRALLATVVNALLTPLSLNVPSRMHYSQTLCIT